MKLRHINRSGPFFFETLYKTSVLGLHHNNDLIVDKRKAVVMTSVVALLS